MKDRRIWVIIGCILVVGIAITSYTSSVVKKVPQEQKIQVLSETTAETAVDSDSAPLQVVPREAQAKMKAGDPEQTEAAGAGIRSEKETEARTAEETEESNSSEDQVQVQAADPPDEGLEPVLHDAEPEQESYTDRLRNLDSQIQKMQEQETDSNVYSAKTSAETQLKMWDGELSTVYNALLEALPQEEAQSLANEERDWLKKRESDAADSSGKSGNTLSYASSMVNQTRERAYELAKRCDALAEEN